MISIISYFRKYFQAGIMVPSLSKVTMIVLSKSFLMIRKNCYSGEVLLSNRDFAFVIDCKIIDVVGLAACSLEIIGTEL